MLTAKFDLAAIAELRNNWFVFRDRRPELYGALTTYDGGVGSREGLSLALTRDFLHQYCSSLLLLGSYT